MAAKTIIVEGPRGVGKTTVCRWLRSQMEGSTLINLTGFKQDGEDGHGMISHYYRGWMNLLEHMNGDYTFIFDRMFFSEMVYSKLYKEYDFAQRYVELRKELVEATTKNGDLFVFYLQSQDPDVFRHRLDRDKVQLFGHIEESVIQSMRQQQGYDNEMFGFNYLYGSRPGVHYHEYDTADMSIQEVQNQIMSDIMGGSHGGL